MYDYENYINQYYPRMRCFEPLRYPRVYHVVYPMVARRCDMMYDYPRQETVEMMADQIYEECRRFHPDIFREYEIDVDSVSDTETNQFLGRRRLFRDLIAILLIRELLRRRRGGFGYAAYY